MRKDYIREKRKKKGEKGKMRKDNIIKKSYRVVQSKKVKKGKRGEKSEKRKRNYKVDNKR